MKFKNKQQDIVSLFQILEENQTYQTVRKLFVSSRLIPGKKQPTVSLLFNSLLTAHFFPYKEAQQRVEVLCKICDEVLQYDISKLLSIVLFPPPPDKQVISLEQWFMVHCSHHTEEGHERASFHNN